ncbi:orf147 (mitochondrion) [Beta vulgaris subsp. vulgaris]|uniref:Orf147 protein n=3 Tax=Beta TaxID=3554 RepID=Q9MFB0_BETVV|nr:orf147 [Beta vulgaris subsp. vulgaris]YP_004222272.1 hypothetical protein LKY74_mgp132 [Beta vulgaris subsp. maritima]YP_004842079.1 hypothetical protein LKY79_mgp130 [Beta macrocarpa]CBJ14096.1 hypothetical protein [Beta vulgaris subsp. maritima]CBJ17505.1 hypothetical protein [Beta vulgaris subsp. maritima]CBL52050.1 hypothetical protein [Beta vulgaris subsp. maritima]CBX24881.1 hypothetical protein [Beta macrocarpa]BAA99340.1 orf147 [Beta vulgaris subsp. vulgaris]
MQVQIIIMLLPMFYQIVKSPQMMMDMKYGRVNKEVDIDVNAQSVNALKSNKEDEEQRSDNAPACAKHFTGKKWRRIPRNEGTSKGKEKIAGTKRGVRESLSGESDDMEVEMELMAKRREVEDTMVKENFDATVSTVAGPTHWALNDQ